MNVWITADTHHRHRDDGQLTELLVAQLRERCGPEDVIVLAGDLGGKDGEGLDECLAAFAPFGAARAFVPGNHDLWISRKNPRDSRWVYDQGLPELAATHGYTLLDHGPLRIELDDGQQLAIAGCYGGYDFSLAQLGRISTGGDQIELGWRTGTFGGMRWNDYHAILADTDRGRFCWPAREIAEDQVRRLSAHLAALEADETVRTVLAITHTAAHRQQIEGHPMSWGRATSTVEWFYGLTGAAGLGNAIRACPKVELTLCGHTHHQREWLDEDGRVWLNAGCDYEKKCWYRWSPGEDVEHCGWLQ